MTPLRVALLSAMLLLAAAGGACGPRPAESPRIERGTALPPPGVTMATTGAAR
jgi:hypothetical protein